MKESFAKRMRKAMQIRNMKQVDLVEKTGLGKFKHQGKNYGTGEFS